MGPPPMLRLPDFLDRLRTLAPGSSLSATLRSRRGVLGQINFPHPARAEQGESLIRTKIGAGSNGYRSDPYASGTTSNECVSLIL